MVVANGGLGWDTHFKGLALQGIRAVTLAITEVLSTEHEVGLCEARLFHGRRKLLFIC